ncbi:hypothetical protein [Rhodococcoides fascians]|uniref:hypothetical protein n=1 Tax=Rhodococcoides fascians TaxID=1828 RepID=UPI0037A3B341
MTLWDAAKVTGLIELNSTTAVAGPKAHEFAHSLASSLSAHRRALSHVIGRYFFSEDPLRPSPAVDVVAGQIVLAAMTSTPRTQLPAVGPAGAGDLYEHIEALILPACWSGSLRTGGWSVTASMQCRNLFARPSWMR